MTHFNRTRNLIAQDCPTKDEEIEEGIWMDLVHNSGSCNDSKYCTVLARRGALRNRCAIQQPCLITAPRELWKKKY
jgi:hypothetical protein